MKTKKVCMEMMANNAVRKLLSKAAKDSCGLLKEKNEDLSSRLLEYHISTIARAQFILKWRAKKLEGASS